MRVDSFNGTLLPSSFATSPAWYLNPASSSTCDQAGPPTAEEVGYTHTLLFATHNSPSTSQTFLLLGLKKRGFGQGTVNGIGGKLNSRETAVEGIIRETEEEVGVTLSADQVAFAGRVRISVEAGEQVTLAVFRTKLSTEQWEQVRESDEIQPTKIPLKAGGEAVCGEGRPEHRVYLELLLDYHLKEAEAEGKDGRVVFDAEVKFHPERRKEELEGGQRAENCREVKSWSMKVYHPS